AAGAEGGGLSLGRRAPGAGFGPSQRVVCEPSPWGRNASVWPDVVAVSPGGAASVFFSISRPGGDASLLIEDHGRGAPAPECPAVKRTRTSRGRLALQARMPRGGRLVRGRWLGLRASCGVACRVRATGRLKIAGRRKRIPFTATTARRPRAGTTSLRVGLTRSRAKVVRRALARRRVVRARVQVRATGGDAKRTLTFRVRVRR
ncbi:MAG TPA: hypothetical protein VEX39_06190, partial [Thermoleophilaceae bacterium]|nr:hypothetical protein [Thermoleophilaceae bacterium]